jgi:hypothetical protein
MVVNEALISVWTWITTNIPTAHVYFHANDNGHRMGNPERNRMIVHSTPDGTRIGDIQRIVLGCTLADPVAEAGYNDQVLANKPSVCLPYRDGILWS